jgi:hypothetical protein
MMDATVTFSTQIRSSDAPVRIDDELQTTSILVLGCGRIRQRIATIWIRLNSWNDLDRSLRQLEDIAAERFYPLCPAASISSLGFCLGTSPGFLFRRAVLGLFSLGSGLVEDSKREEGQTDMGESVKPVSPSP